MEDQSSKAQEIVATEGRSLIRDNLMTIKGYSPYCGNDKCQTLPRTNFNGEQFTCPHCDWVSAFDDEFIKEYKSCWGLDKLKAKSKASAFIPAMLALAESSGIHLQPILDSLPRGATPNRHKPHQGKKEMERRLKRINEEKTK